MASSSLAQEGISKPSVGARLHRAELIKIQTPTQHTLLRRDQTGKTKHVVPVTEAQTVMA